MARLGSGTTTDTTSTSNELYYAGEAFRLAYDVGAGTGSRRTQTDFIGNVITAKAIAVEVTGDDVSTAVPLGTCTVDGSGTTTTRANCSGTWVQNSTVDLIPTGTADISVRDGLCSVSSSSSASYTTENTCVERGDCTVGDVITGDLTLTQCITSGGTEDTFVPYTWAANTTKAVGQFYVYIPSTILKDVGFTESPQPGEPKYIAYSVDYTEQDNGTGDNETRVIETDVIGFRWTPMFDITA